MLTSVAPDMVVGVPHVIFAFCAGAVAASTQTADAHIRMAFIFILGLSCLGVLGLDLTGCQAGRTKASDAVGNFQPLVDD